MIIKIFKEKPLSYGLYNELPKEIESIEGLVYEPSDREIELINSGKPLMFDGKYIIVDEEAEVARELKREQLEIRRAQYKTKLEIEDWFKAYDIASTQFQRKKDLYQHGLLESELYRIELDKMLALYQEAEEKAAILKKVRQNSL